MSRALHFVSRSKKRLALSGVVAALLLGAGGASAYYTSTGAGSAASHVGTASDVTLSAGTPSSPLYPGGSGDVAIQVSNPNNVSVHLASLVLDTSQGTSGFAVDAAHSGCGLSALAYTAQNNGGAGFNVPTGSSTLDLSGAISLSSTAASACQGATFTVYLKVGP